MNARLTHSLLALCFLVSLSLAGCDSTSPVTKANYDQITTGMTEQEVEDILGKPNQQAGGEATLPSVGLTGLDIPAGKVGGAAKTWVDGSNSISITFANGKVLSKVWSGQ